jgi:hypothetical protein
MSNDSFLQVQAIELQRLLDKSGNDPILGPQLRDRLDDVEKKLQSAKQQPGELFPKDTPVLPRAAIFLRGGGVKDSEGISPSLAGEALIQYERMFTEQALHDERLAAKASGRQRRPRGAAAPCLLFTGTPRGSFGLEFVPQLRDDDSLTVVHAQSLVHVAEALTRVAESDAQSLDKTLSEMPPRVIQPLKQFLKTLAHYEAELRFAFQDHPSRSLSAAQVKVAADLLERDVEQVSKSVEGVFRGVTRDSGVFDLRLDDDSVITGTVVDQLTEEDLERIDALTNQRCVADLQKTTIRKIGGTETTNYVLVDASSIESV